MKVMELNQILPKVDSAGFIVTFCGSYVCQSDPNYYQCIILCCELNSSGYSMDGNNDVGIHDPRSVDLPASDSGKQPHVWSSSPKHGCKTDIGKQIFCNRSLNMKNIVAVGFDMDYTLAQYKAETFESLAYQGTIKKLVYDLGYPLEVCPISLIALFTIFF